MRVKTRPQKIGATVLLACLCSAVVLSAAAAPSAQKLYERLRLLASVLSLVERYYIEPVSSDELIVGATSGMVRTLDPHSALLSPDDFAVLEADTRGEFGGVGLEVGFKDKVITVIAPIEGSPAARAGIRSGDRLISVDGKDAANMGIDEAIQRMRGKVGTAVSAVFLRLGETVPYKVELVREIIAVKSVEVEDILPGYLWLRIRMFQDGTTTEVKEAYRQAEAKFGIVKGMLLDFRGNPGGLLDEAIRLSDLFLTNGDIVTTRGRDGRAVDRYTAHRLGTLENVPLTVLIDEASASAAEITAGAIQDHGRAMLIGRRSFGKGSVQSILPLIDGFGLKLTIARYYTPNGRAIQAEGILPDVVIDSKTPPPNDQVADAFPSEAELPGRLAPQNAEAGLDLRRIEDYQLRVALQILVATGGGLKRLDDVDNSGRRGPRRTDPE